MGLFHEIEYVQRFARLPRMAGPVDVPLADKLSGISHLLIPLVLDVAVRGWPLRRDQHEGAILGLDHSGIEEEAVAVEVQGLRLGTGFGSLVPPPILDAM